MSIDSVLTAVQQYVGSFKQCWVLLQAAVWQLQQCNS